MNERNILATIICLVCMLSACKENTITPKAVPKQYLIILDLSDRLLAADQSEKDKAVIKAVFTKFEDAVRKQLVIQSKDKFQISILPQRRSSLNQNSWEDSLSIDMAFIPAQNKLKAIEAFKNSLEVTIKKLYQAAHIGTSKQDFFGVDIWQFFHDNIGKLVIPGYQTQVIVITDGYFDFNNNNHTLQNGKRFTHTGFVDNLLGTNWKQKATSEDIGLIPVKLPTNVAWTICGIRPKNANDIMLNEKLSYFWEKWLMESGAKNILGEVLDGSPNEMAEQMQRILTNGANGKHLQ